MPGLPNRGPILRLTTILLTEKTTRTLPCAAYSIVLLTASLRKKMEKEQPLDHPFTSCNTMTFLCPGVPATHHFKHTRPVLSNRARRCALPTTRCAHIDYCTAVIVFSSHR